MTEYTINTPRGCYGKFQTAIQAQIAAQIMGIDSYMDEISLIGSQTIISLDSILPPNMMAPQPSLCANNDGH